VGDTFDPLKPEDWGYLFVMLCFQALLQWWIVRNAKKKNASMNLNTDELSVEEIAKAWTKGHIKSGFHQALPIMGLVILLFVTGLVFVVLEQLLLGALVIISALIFLLTQAYKKRVLDLMALDEDKFQELKEYYAENKEALVAEALSDPEVIQVMQTWPSWIRKYNLRTTRLKNFRPMRNQHD
jgi:hypothetical protein